MAYKNTVNVQYNNSSITLHFINRPHYIECVIYEGGNPKKTRQIAYFDKDHKRFLEVGHWYNYKDAKTVAKVLLYRHFVKDNEQITPYLNKMTIDYLGDMEVFNNEGI